MSVTYHAYVFYGQRFDADATKKVTQVRACSHAEAPGAKFCPECGKPSWKESVERMDEAFRAGDVGYMDIRSHDSSMVVVGVCLGTTDDDDEDAKDIINVGNSVKGKLGQLAKDWELDFEDKAKLLLVMCAG